MNKEIFDEIGFTQAEKKVYLALLELGPSSAGPILKKTKLQNSVGHSTIQRLIKKGHISFIQKGRKKEYTSTDPKNILKELDEKRARFSKIIPQLEILKTGKTTQKAKIYQGFKGFKNALQDLISEYKKGDEYLIFSLGMENIEEYKHIISYYKDFEDERKKKGIISKAIAPKWQKKQLKESTKKINILFVNFPTPLDVSIFRDKILLSSWEKNEDTFFLLQSKGLSESFKQYFYSIWNKYK